MKLWRPQADREHVADFGREAEIRCRNSGMPLPKKPRSHEDLPVFKQAWDVVVEIHKTGENVPRSFRYNELPVVKLQAMEAVHCIRRAQSDKEERVRHLEKGLESLEFVRLYVRLMYDLRMISLKRFTLLARLIENTVRQLSGWLKSSGKQMG